MAARAASAWPLQPAYWQGLARLAARAQDTEQLARAVRALDAMELASTVFEDTTVAMALPTVRDSSGIAAMRMRARDIVRGEVVATIADTSFFAEGLDVHVASGTVFVASIRRGTVVVVRNGVTRDLRLDRDPRIGAVFGVRVAADGKTLWCTTTPHPMRAPRADGESSTSAALLHVRVSDGAILDFVALPPSDHPSVPGYLVLLPDGFVLVSDSYCGAFFQWRPSTRVWRPFADARFRSPQGMAVVPGGRSVIVADYSHGLFRLDLTTGSVTRIADRDDTTVLGLDGMAWYRDGVIAVQNGVEPARIVRISLDAALTRVLALTVIDRQPTFAPEPTIGAIVGDSFVYVANSQWNAYDDRGQRRAGVSLTPTHLVCVPILVNRSVPARCLAPSSAAKRR